MSERAPDSVTYNLGHNEQMQLAIVIGAVAEVLRNALADSDYDPGLFISDEELSALSMDTLAHFEGVFSMPGLVSITKDEDD